MNVGYGFARRSINHPEVSLFGISVVEVLFQQIDQLHPVINR